MKREYIIVSIILLIIKNISVTSFEVIEYLSAIEEIMLNEDLLLDYTKRTLKLISDKDYFYGKQRNDFPCEIIPNVIFNETKTVHQLTPHDIECVGAIGDSLSAGLGAHAILPTGLIIENRGSSWSIGGDHTFEKMVTLPNILRKYNPNLKGYSTKSSIIFLNGRNASHNGLNVAKSGDQSEHTLQQAQILVQRIKDEQICDLHNDWKMITLFIGGNDLCMFCKDSKNFDSSNYIKSINETLFYLYENLPRTFINLVLVLNVTGVKELNDGGPICRLFHKKTCSCAAFPTLDDSIRLEKLIEQYQFNLTNLINSGIFDQRPDFTVVVQPFLSKTDLPRDIDGQIDFSYFAPDCFHFSGKAHSDAAVSLWNNLFQPIGRKQTFWHNGEYSFVCPTKEFPYFFTRLNSPK